MPSSSQWPEPQDLARLISEARSGSIISVNALLSVLRPAFVGFFGRRLSVDAAEDLAQEALIRVARSLPTIEPERGDRFIVTVACNLLRTAYAREARDFRRWAPAELAEATESSATADRQAEYQELVRAVHRACITELPPPLRDLALGVLRGETPGELADRFQVNPVTVRTRLLRARRILRSELRPYLDASDAEVEETPDSPPEYPQISRAGPRSRWTRSPFSC